MSDLSSAYMLSFLTTHEWDDCVDHFGHPVAHQTIERDIAGSINLKAIEKTFTVTLSNKLQNTSNWAFEIPGTTFVDLNNATGTLFTTKDAKPLAGSNKCWIQQYPGQGGAVGRTVVEFYTDTIITAVFKTNVDSHGASGNGEWKQL